MTPLSTLTNEALHALVARSLEGVTEGPWCTVNHETYHGGMGCTPDGCPGHDSGVAFYISGPVLDPQCDGPGWVGSDESEADHEARDKAHWKQADRDCKFIAQSRDLVPELDRRLRETEAKLEVTQEGLTAIRDMPKYDQDDEHRLRGKARACLDRIAALTQP